MKECIVTDKRKPEEVHWHAVFTASRAEKKVRDRLTEEWIECFLPVQTLILDKQMKEFRFLLDFSEEAIEMVNEEVEEGDFIRVVKGPLKGLEGELVKINTTYAK